MPPKIEVRATSRPEPDCERCSTGAGVAVTLFIPGLCDDADDQGRCVYRTTNLSEFETAFADGVSSWSSISGDAENKSTFCCQKIFCAAELDPCMTARENADALRSQLLDLFEDLSRKEWVDFIHLHVLGFSAGGIIAVNLISGMPCSIDRPDSVWPCPGMLPGPITIQIDLVTMATPFGRPGLLELPLIRPFFDSLARWILTPILIRIGRRGCLRGWHNRMPLLHSLFQNDYEDLMPKRVDGRSCVCRFVAFVSSSEHGDSDGGDRNPAEDARLEAWKPEVVLLRDGWSGREVSHTEVPKELHRDENYRRVLDPGCACTEVP